VVAHRATTPAPPRAGGESSPQRAAPNPSITTRNVRGRLAVPGGLIGRPGQGKPYPYATPVHPGEAKTRMATRRSNLQLPLSTGWER